MLNTEEGMKALALAAGVIRIAQFHCDAPVSKIRLLVIKLKNAQMSFAAQVISTIGRTFTA